MIVMAGVCFECREVIVGCNFHDVPRPGRTHYVLANFKRADYIDFVRQRSQLIDYRPPLGCAGFRFEFEEHDMFNHGSLVIPDYRRARQELVLRMQASPWSLPSLRLSISLNGGRLRELPSVVIQSSLR